MVALSQSSSRKSREDINEWWSSSCCCSCSHATEISSAKKTTMAASSTSRCRFCVHGKISSSASSSSAFPVIPILVVWFLLVSSSVARPAHSSETTGIRAENQTFRPGEELQKLKYIRARLGKINKPPVKTIQALQFIHSFTFSPLISIHIAGFRFSHFSILFLMFQSPDGDVIDCVSSHQQPAFDHPKLKGQKPLVSFATSFFCPLQETRIPVLELRCIIKFGSKSAGSAGEAGRGHSRRDDLGEFSAVECIRRVMPRGDGPDPKDDRAGHAEGKFGP